MLLPLPVFCAAQEYPAKPVRVVIPVAPGGGVDIVARFVGAKLSDDLKQQFVADNRAGAAGIIGKRYRKWLAENRERAEEASKATPNMVGYRPKEPRAAGDRGEYIERFDREFSWPLIHFHRLRALPSRSTPEPIF